MHWVHHLDDRWFLNINAIARQTGWLHGALLAYAKYGLMVSALTWLVESAWERRRLAPPLGPRHLVPGSAVEPPERARP